MSELMRWLRTSSAYDVLDDAVCGSLLQSTADDLCADFNVTPAELRRAIHEAIQEGF